MFSQARRKPRSLAAAILGVLALLSVVVTSGPVAAASQKQYEFNFVNGITLAGVSTDKTHFLPDAGGTDANNPIGMNVHLSCSDKFEGGFGQKDGPNAQTDSAWQIASYSIGELKNGVLTLKCGDSFTPPGPPPAPAIKLVKTVNGQDANTPTGPRVTVGESVTLGYVVTNTGNVDLQSVSVTDLDLGPVSCPQDGLAPNESMTCDEASVLVTQAGQVFMEARTDAVGKSTAPATAPGPGKHAFIFVFENGQTISGTSESNTAFVPNAGGNDANNPTGMNVHVSCSDKFEGGFGQKDGPDPVLDSAWKIASYSIFSNGTLKCGDASTTVMIPVSDTDPIYYIADPVPSSPAIQIIKTVNGFDANTPPGVEVAVGSTIELGYKVTNTGDTPLSNVIVTDIPGGNVVSCAAASSLTVGQMVMCPIVTMQVTVAGQVYMNAGVEGTSPNGTVVTDTDPINYIAKTPPPTLSPPPDCSVALVGADVKITWDAGDGATIYAVKRNNNWLGRTTSLMFVDSNPAPGTYEYFVRSINGENRTDYVSCGMITIPEEPTTPPGPPVCSVFYSNGRAVVSWEAVAGARSYQVRHNGFWQVRTAELSWVDDTPGTGLYTVEAVFAGEVKSSRTTCAVIEPTS